MKEFFKKTFTKENLKKFFFSYIWLMVLIFVIDIVTKWTIAKHFDFNRPTFKNEIEIIPNFLYISLGFNEGMAWSLLSGTTGKIVLACVSAILGAAFITYYVKSYRKLNNLLKISLALMIAGAIGNFIDRAFYWKGTVGFSGVIDWIQVYFGSTSNSFPTFNIADSSLVIGVILLVIQLIIDEVKEAKAKAARGEYKYSPEELKKMKEKEAEKHEENQSK